MPEPAAADHPLTMNSTAVTPDHIGLPDMYAMWMTAGHQGITV